jgi:NitT/TauT family transport system ATP-binding protein
MKTMTSASPATRPVDGCHLDPAAVIAVSDVCKYFAQPSGEIIEVLAGVNLTVKQQEFLSIIGPSGCGKSTIFNVIAGLIPPSSGKVLVLGEEIRHSSGHVGYMMQRDLLLPWRNVLDNVTIGLEVQGVAQKERYERAGEYLDRYGLAAFARSYPSMLSGGMRQRVALIRTLVTNPDIILLDEPLTGLDANGALVVKALLRSLAAQGKTILFCSHILEVVVRVCSRLIIINKGRTVIEGSAAAIREATGASTLEQAFSQLTGTRDVASVTRDFLSALEKS